MYSLAIKTILVMLLFLGINFAEATDLQSSTKAISIEPVVASDYIGESSYALVVGIDDYADDEVPDLTTCKSDALAMYKLLTDPQSVGVSKENAYLLLGQQASKRSILTFLNKLSQIPKDSTVYIYFSGHEAKSGDEAFWIAQDSELSNLAVTALRTLK